MCLNITHEVGKIGELALALSQVSPGVSPECHFYVLSLRLYNLVDAWRAQKVPGGPVQAFCEFVFEAYEPELLTKRPRPGALRRMMRKQILLPLSAGAAYESLAFAAQSDLRLLCTAIYDASVDYQNALPPPKWVTGPQAGVRITYG